MPNHHDTRSTPGISIRRLGEPTLVGRKSREARDFGRQGTGTAPETTKIPDRYLPPAFGAPPMRTCLALDPGGTLWRSQSVLCRIAARADMAVSAFGGLGHATQRPS